MKSWLLQNKSWSVTMLVVGLLFALPYIDRPPQMEQVDAGPELAPMPVPVHIGSYEHDLLEFSYSYKPGEAVSLGLRTTRYENRWMSPEQKLNALKVEVLRLITSPREETSLEPRFKFVGKYPLYVVNYGADGNYVGIDFADRVSLEDGVLTVYGTDVRSSPYPYENVMAFRWP